MRQPREETMLDFVSPSSGPNLSPKTSEEEARERAPLSVNGCANGFPGASEGEERRGERERGRSTDRWTTDGQQFRVRTPMFTNPHIDLGFREDLARHPSHATSCHSLAD